MTTYESILELYRKNKDNFYSDYSECIEFSKLLLQKLKMDLQIPEGKIFFIEHHLYDEGKDIEKKEITDIDIYYYKFYYCCFAIGIVFIDDKFKFNDVVVLNIAVLYQNNSYYCQFDNKAYSFSKYKIDFNPLINHITQKITEIYNSKLVYKRDEDDVRVFIDFKTSS